MQESELQDRRKRLIKIIVKCSQELSAYRICMAPLEARLQEAIKEKYEIEKQLAVVTVAAKKGVRIGKTIGSREVKAELTAELNALLAEHGVVLRKE